MAKQRRKKGADNTFQQVLDFIDLVDTAFERLTGAKISDRLREASIPTGVDIPRQCGCSTRPMIG